MIKIICVGKIKENYLKELIDDYKKRIMKYSKIELIEVKDSEILKEEENNILKVMNDKDYYIALSITGNTYDSVSFAKHIESLLTLKSNITFIIGGSNGLSLNVLNKCQEKISFSSLTFPHGLFRSILLEQLYRTFKINNNESYHK